MGCEIRSQSAAPEYTATCSFFLAILIQSLLDDVMDRDPDALNDRYFSMIQDVRNSGATCSESRTEESPDTRSAHPASQIPTETAHRLLDHVAVIAGLDRDSTTWSPDWRYGAKVMQAWLDRGWTTDLCQAAIKKALRSKLHRSARYAPPETPEHFTWIIDKELAIREARRRKAAEARGRPAAPEPAPIAAHQVAAVAIDLTPAAPVTTCVTEPQPLPAAVPVSAESMMMDACLQFAAEWGGMLLDRAMQVVNAMVAKLPIERVHHHFTKVAKLHRSGPQKLDLVERAIASELSDLHPVQGDLFAAPIAPSPWSATSAATKAAPQASDPIQEPTAADRWQRSVGNLAGDAIAMRAFWTREFGDWQDFETPTTVLTLVKQAAEAWAQLARDLAHEPPAKVDRPAVQIAADRAEARSQAMRKLHS